MSAYLPDVQRGTLSAPAGEERTVSEEETMLLYWRALEAPLGRIAAATGLSEAAARAGMEALNVPQDAGINLRGGAWPEENRPWAERHALTIFREGLNASPDTPFLHVAGEGELTRRELSGLVGRLWAGLAEAGIGRGDVIAIDADQRFEPYIAVMAALLRGATVLRLDPTAGPETVSQTLEASGARLIISSLLDWIPEGKPRRIALSPCTDGEAFEDCVAACPDPPADWMTAIEVAPTDAALIGHTSGSTGKPQPVFNTHEAIFRTSSASCRRFGFNSADVFCAATDFIALSAFRWLFTLPLMAGGRLVIPDSDARAGPLHLSLLCTEQNVTRLTALPNGWRGMIQMPNRLYTDILGSLETGLSGSGVLDSATADGFRERFGAPLVDYYGSREIGTVLYADPETPGSISAAGGEVSECLIRVVDEHGAPCAAGEIGELWVHTDCERRRPEGDASQVTRGWYRTGDLGRALEDGRIELAGRKRDIIKTPSGLRIAPIEVEQALARSPDILEACATGFTGADGVERLGAAVILRRDMAEKDLNSAEIRLKSFIGRELGGYKAPARILILDDFPRVGRRKPDRAALRKRIEAEAARDA
jgi:acyl-CoA synthetase (AMP-forming)/AMP-acid ligase II